MRLTCPKCGATYALATETLPQGGGHVQCGACHTRWFVRHDRPAPAELSEDQIVARLEGRGALRAVPRIDDDGEIDLDRDESAEQPRSAPIAFPGPPRPVVQPPRPSAAPTTPPDPLQAPGPGPTPTTHPAAATPLRPRPAAERAAPDPALPPAVVAPAPAGRGGFGLLVALVLAALCLGAYLRADALAARVPAAAPALAAYVEAVDAGRGWLETRLGPARDQLLGG